MAAAVRGNRKRDDAQKTQQRQAAKFEGVDETTEFPWRLGGIAYWVAGDGQCDVALQTLRRELGNPCDLGNPCSILAAGMLGRVVAQEIFQTGKGYFVKFQRAIQGPVHFAIAPITPQLREEHQAMTDVIEGAAT